MKVKALRRGQFTFMALLLAKANTLAGAFDLLEKLRRWPDMHRRRRSILLSIAYGPAPSGPYARFFFIT